MKTNTRTWIIYSNIWNRADQDGHQHIDGRCMIVGSKQRPYDRYDKSNGSLPTVIAASIVLTGIIDANEGRTMFTIDIGNTFPQADNNERILMLLRNKVVELRVRVNSYQNIGAYMRQNYRRLQ